MTPPNPNTITSPLVYGDPIPPEIWENIRTEFGLPTLDQASARLASIHPDPEPVMRELVRVFVGSETLCPGYQFSDTLSVKPAVQVLFARALELPIAHNYFSAWMTTPCPDLDGRRPVDLLHSPTPPLLHALGRFGASKKPATKLRCGRGINRHHRSTGRVPRSRHNRRRHVGRGPHNPARTGPGGAPAHRHPHELT